MNHHQQPETLSNDSGCPKEALGMKSNRYHTKEYRKLQSTQPASKTEDLFHLNISPETESLFPPISHQSSPKLHGTIPYR
ncbi:hypothetical protein HanRHA438_Chr08g0346171 [Helianthus annuus]|nr:hypothetical protein HanHA300_Chr08g0276691 [Helianthus annuus]KAJ0546496.1 hypothetical protein HanIR_Chr08g0361671 [Helianthus annuus]KAJ0553207.1 hypothetical protein HanHA89_Chr08g0293881 [Helianthus annuus]KAJ0722120.1 hypothetical protein HanOQP8_Chr08g0283151 [Helianthus annuus]KAJ0897476.1 hypothetical protein HanRHA438_Chr08g0346171 [Helianthus annuus]